jgi:RNA polymerase sigma factor (sigma-70 family)
VCQGDSDPLPFLQALERYRPEWGDAVTAAIQAVLCLNVQRCRFQRYQRFNPEATVETYVDEVVERYKATHAYLFLIQQGKDPEVWETLTLKTRRWVYGFLIHWKLDETTRTSLTLDVAQETCIELMHAHFPYDCEFDAWACTITHNIYFKYMHRHFSSLVVDEFDISEAEEWLSTIEDLSLLNPETLLAERQWLLDALEKLSPKQKDMIWLFYFEGWLLSQIAAYFHMSMNAVYKLHFDALARLRKILGINRHKDE